MGSLVKQVENEDHCSNHESCTKHVASALMRTVLIDINRDNKVNSCCLPFNSIKLLACSSMFMKSVGEQHPLYSGPAVHPFYVDLHACSKTLVAICPYMEVSGNACRKLLPRNALTLAAPLTSEGQRSLVSACALTMGARAKNSIIDC